MSLLQRKYVLILTIVAILGYSSIFPQSISYAKYEDWTELPELIDVPLVKTFTITFNKEIKVEDIDGILIESEDMFIPVTIHLKGDEATVTPVEYLRPDTDYTLRIFLDNSRYFMNFSTEQTDENFIYMGKKDVVSEFAPDETIIGMNYYRLDLGGGNPVRIYVTDDYEEEYGKGFAYTEVEEMITSIEKIKDFEPYLNGNSSLDIFFYTDDSDTPFPEDTQGKAATWGEHTEILINGSTIPFDFRPVVTHELVHYFDQQSSLNNKEFQPIYEEYWGEDYRFWLLEGGAEYSAHFHHTYPRNTLNDLDLELVKDAKYSIERYVNQLKSSKEVLDEDIKLDSFDDIKRASDSNYGVALSLFWYLVEEYGYEEVYEYVEYISDHFDPEQSITQSEKDDAAIEFFGKTEESILEDWLEHFDQFE
ncbi:Ig-like domain-containing protein [Chengkuizengella axinellae]|uniref:Ig-like domain-containing protein n=1 Tax=Chengkuizengella axinellae TaxID=3064388 RepID=A0ABT9IZZ2_9BACL|nr:Ig-like domain-containing protein [Chengkuizengella sp. 2205SS18-9]MDP5274942.1 Ig-like domain-containing protein [Chengkuizengella sp. 2205SS18-9]